MVEHTEYIQLAFEKIIQTRAYTSIILKSRANPTENIHEKDFALYVDPAVGQALQRLLTKEESARPQTHDLISSIFLGYSVRLKQVVITDLQETTFFARLFLEQEKDSFRQILEIDARPSDCIILAFMHNAPIFCARHVLEKAIAYVE